ncbi:CoxE [Microcoleus sp. herbarium2]|uniref:CoxE n=1 Tax=Microcoleus sp. herbarium2 TaxID=3055433 RepID=UPI002FD6E9DC
MIKHLSFEGLLPITVDEALAIVESVMDNKHLTEVQKIVFRLSWEGKSYQEIAQVSNCTSGYIKDVGFQLWKQLSESFGEKVGKHNLQSVIKRYLKSRQDDGPSAGFLEKSIVDELPLIELFSQLREAGFPLGIDEYKLLLEALQKGFGTSDRTSLYRLCKTLWVKSAEDKRLFDHHFELIVKESQEAIPAIPEKPANSAPETEDSGIIETPPILTEETSKPIISAPPPELVKAIEDEVQAAKAVMQATNKYEAISDRQFILTSEYFPVTRRQMKQSWRYLRRPVREGPPVEFDVEATVNQIGRQGILLSPVLVPRRINRSQLLLLIDRDGSMVPFHDLSHRLAETAVRGGRLGNAGIYYFQNCPVEYLYHDPYQLEAEKIDRLLANLRPEKSAMLIFSDAGAARGGYSEERVELTAAFLQQIKAKVRYVAWLNPMPESRWGGTTAGKVARLVPMFEMARRGLQEAIGLLRGKSQNSVFVGTE